MQLKSLMRSSSFGSSSKRSNYSRNFELPDDFTPAGGEGGHEYFGGPMLPIFLDDLRRNNDQDLVEVTLELDDNSIVLCSVTPTPPHNNNANEEEAVVSGIFGRTLSAASKLHRKFSWLRSPSTRSRASSSDVDDSHFHHQQQQSNVNQTAMTSREVMRSNLQLVRNKSSAQRALGGLRFISKTTEEPAADELWKKVEARFDALAKDGLLSREDFGDCIGSLNFKLHISFSGIIAWKFKCLLHLLTTPPYTKLVSSISSFPYLIELCTISIGMADSKEFAVGVFDALVRRRRQKTAKITKAELHDFWLQISDQSFDARLQIFFDMYVCGDSRPFQLLYLFPLFHNSWKFIS